MKKKSLILLLSLFGLTLGASAQLIKKVKGNGNYVVKNIKVDHFNEVEMSSDINVYYTQDASKARKVTIEAESNIIDMVKLKVKKGSLHIQMDRSLNVENGVVKVWISSEELYHVRNSGQGSFELQGKLASSELDLSVTGNGQIKMEHLNIGALKADIVSTGGDILLGGKAQKASYGIKLGGEIRADNLTAETVNCVIFGGGSVGCHPLKSLKNTFWGTGKVYYRGDPEISNGGVGKGEVIPIKK